MFRLLFWFQFWNWNQISVGFGFGFLETILISVMLYQRTVVEFKIDGDSTRNTIHLMKYVWWGRTLTMGRRVLHKMLGWYNDLITVIEYDNIGVGCYYKSFKLNFLFKFYFKSNQICHSMEPLIMDICLCYMSLDLKGSNKYELFKFFTS